MFGRQIPIHVIDFEGAPSYGVVEYGVATLVDGKVTDTHTRLCRALAPIDPHDIAVHGITYEESLAHAPFADDYDFFVDLRKKGPLAAHNARYEARLVKKTWAFPPLVPAWHKIKEEEFLQVPLGLRIESGEANLIHENDSGFGVNDPKKDLKKQSPSSEGARGWAENAFQQECATWAPWIDSCALARKLAPGLSRYKLQIVVEELGLQNELDVIALNKCPPERRMYHAALYDAIASALILKKLLCGANDVAQAHLFTVKWD